jgi:hypothetical protein
VAARLLRQAAAWREVTAALPTLEGVLLGTLRLAVANTHSNHREVSQGAVATLSALILLVLEGGSPLHGALLEFGAVHGALLLQGLLLAQLSLNSAAHLPKVSMGVGACLYVCVCVRARACVSGRGSQMSLYWLGSHAVMGRLILMFIGVVVMSTGGATFPGLPARPCFVLSAHDHSPLRHPITTRPFVTSLPLTPSSAHDDSPLCHLITTHPFVSP